MLALGSVGLLQACSQAGRLEGQAPPPVPLPAGIEVAFNHRAEARYRSPIHGEPRAGDDLEALLLQTIQGAERELLVAVQELSLPQLAKALVEQHRRGVRVQVVLENTYSQPWSSPTLPRASIHVGNAVRPVPTALLKAWTQGSPHQGGFSRVRAIRRCAASPRTRGC